MATPPAGRSGAEVAGFPAGDLAGKVQDALDRLDHAEDRLREHAERGAVEGLTDPDPPSGEQWDVGQVWAHLAEFGSYWLVEFRSIIEAASDQPVAFGRTKKDPHRIAMIEQNRDQPIAAQLEIVVADIAALRAQLSELTTQDWGRRGRHETLGDMDLWTFLDHFSIGHYHEHADQLDGLGSTDE